MKRKLIIHICPAEKFIGKSISLHQDNAFSDRHEFWVIGKRNEYALPNLDNVTVFSNVFKLLLVWYQLYFADKIILHGLLIKHIPKLLVFQKRLLNKSYWIIWGADLYSSIEPAHTISAKIKKFCISKIIKNVANTITHIKGDHELACRWHNGRAKHHYSFIYESNVFDASTKNNYRTAGTTIKIQIGNSAIPSVNHISAIEQCGKLLLKDPAEIILPLSYGNSDYRQEVLSACEIHLKGAYTAIVDFMPIEEYVEHLAGIDVAIFPAKRQQAMGNITQLLGYGKKVYLDSSITSYQSLQDLGLKIYDVKTISFTPISQQDAENNMMIIREWFTRDRLIDDLNTIYRS